MSQSKIRSSLSWLGVGAVIAGCAAVALVQTNAPASAQTPSVTHVQTTVCRGAASGQVATSSQGQAQGWGASALNTLCNGAEDSAEPANCFNHTMTSNSVSWARGSTTWQPNNALRLCAGARDAGRRLNCFTGRIGNNVAWSQAIDQCIAEERTLNVQIQRPTVAPPVTAVITPAAPSGAREPTVEEVATARRAAYATPAQMDCQGPLRVEVSQVRRDDARQGTMIQAFFTAATSAADVGPGKCWRRGGWGNGMFMAPDNQGVILYQAVLGTCPLISSMRFENGALAEITSTDRIIGMTLIELGRSRGGAALDTTYLGRSDTGSGATGPTRYTGVAPVGASTRPGWCE
jgi:hypothetical protein